MIKPNDRILKTDEGQLVVINHIESVTLPFLKKFYILTVGGRQHSVSYDTDSQAHDDHDTLVKILESMWR